MSKSEAEHFETGAGEHPPLQEIPSAMDIDAKEAHGQVTQIQTASVALAAAVAAQKPRLLSRNMIQLYAIMGVGYLVSTMNGFDSSLMGSINAMIPYQESFGLSGAGSSTGVIFIIYNMGQIAAFPFCGLLADGYGRRMCRRTRTRPIHRGRFVLGFGAALASAAGPAYTVELAHPAYRGTMAGMYNNFWWMGNILAGWTTYGSNKNLTDSWAWRVPTLVQAGIPAIVMVLILFFPESPRWLIAHDRREEALAVFAKYHGDGDEQSPIVQLQYHEIIEQLQMTRNDNPWWDFRELVNTPGARYRLYMVIGMSFIGQWSGNNVVNYFMPEMIKNAGITSTNKQLLINAINPIFSMIGAVYGATLLDKLGRRTMMLAGLSGALLSYIMLTAFTAASEHHPNLSYGVIVSIFLFGVIFAWGFTPLQTLYAVECLENRTRAKGSGLNFLFLNIAMVVNTYGISVGIAAIEWKLYLTAGKTLEEMASIFDAPNPRKESTKKTSVALDESGRVMGINDNV
ncbi:hypothetical protein H4I96_06170 [Botrytis cinerea]